MIATYLATLNADDSVPQTITVPRNAAPMSFRHAGESFITFLVDDEETETEERTVLFARESLPGVAHPAPALDGVDLTPYFFLGSSRGWSVWIS